MHPSHAATPVAALDILSSPLSSSLSLRVNGLIRFVGHSIVIESLLSYVVVGRELLCFRIGDSPSARCDNNILLADNAILGGQRGETWSFFKPFAHSSVRPSVRRVVRSSGYVRFPRSPFRPSADRRFSIHAIDTHGGSTAKPRAGIGQRTFLLGFVTV